MKKLVKFFREEEAATMVEYGLMLALIAIVCIVAVTSVGAAANTIFEACAAGLQVAAP